MRMLGAVGLSGVMRFVGGKHAFAFSTHGTMPVYFFPSIVPKMKRRGLVVIGTGDWYGNCSLYHHMEPYPTAGYPDEIDLKKAEEFGSEMVEHSRRIAAGESHLIPPEPAPNTTRTPPLKDFKAGLKFHEEKCLYPECRLCMENCPMNGIDLTIKPPIIASPCIVCEWCARICPTGAIDILEWLEAGDSDKYISMMKSENLPLLEKAEAEGRFRWLIPKESITFIKSYKLHKRHPQWVIGEGLHPPDNNSD